jgi:hypothetical protein
MRQSLRTVVHPPGTLDRLIDRLRGRDQLLIRAGDDLPLLLVSFPRGNLSAAREIETAYTHMLRSLRPDVLAPYKRLFAVLPHMVVVLLRATNPCGCLGHHHPRGSESRITRRLAADLGCPISEIDLAFEEIRNWRPQPLSALATGELHESVRGIHFQVAILAVLLHELEHLAFPEESEKEVRARSNQFYSQAMEELVSEELGGDYGMASPPPRP